LATLKETQGSLTEKAAADKQNILCAAGEILPCAKKVMLPCSLQASAASHLWPKFSTAALVLQRQRSLSSEGQRLRKYPNTPGGNNPKLTLQEATLQNYCQESGDENMMKQTGARAFIIHPVREFWISVRP
jgi:hypothetical protein